MFLCILRISVFYCVFRLCENQSHQQNFKLAAGPWILWGQAHRYAPDWEWTGSGSCQWVARDSLQRHSWSTVDRLEEEYCLWILDLEKQYSDLQQLDEWHTARAAHVQQLWCHQQQQQQLHVDWWKLLAWVTFYMWGGDFILLKIAYGYEVGDRLSLYL